MASSNTRPHRIIQNFHLIWLDGNIDAINNDDCRNCITKFREAVNAVKTFDDPDQCIDFITDNKEEKALLVISEEFQQIIAPIVQQISQVSLIYIFCRKNTSYQKLINEISKVRGIFTDITSVCEALRDDVRAWDKNSLSISCVKKTDSILKQKLDTLDCSFMYTQILKEILITIDFQQLHRDEFLLYCRELFADNVTQLRNIDQIEKDYSDHQPVWWYTYSSFLYSMLNRALRTMEVGLIIKMGFFLKDLHQNIVTLHAEQLQKEHHPESVIIYRGQGLSQIDFHKIKETQCGLLSFNNFLSTSLDRTVSFAFAESITCDPDMIGVVFEITINSSTLSSPFANINNISYYHEEKEILFSMHSVFRIEQVKQIDGNNRLWQVDLTLTSDNDPELNLLTEYIREETSPDKEGWYRLGGLLIKLGQYDKAHQLFDIILHQTTDEKEKSNIYARLGYAMDSQGKYEDALDYYEKSIKIIQHILPPTHPNLATSYNNIGVVYKNMGEYSKAISYYDKGLEMRQKTLRPNHPALATSHNNIAAVYDNMGEYSKTLSFYDKALEIRQKTLPPNHPDLATSYNNIAAVYDNMGEYSKALSFYDKALEIEQKTLPPNHPNLATSYNNIGAVYYNMGEYSKALSFYDKALEIQQKTLPPNHPLLATSYNNIGFVYDNMGEYSKALPYFELALDIKQRSLPPNHPSIKYLKENIEIIEKKI